MAEYTLPDADEARDTKRLRLRLATEGSPGARNSFRLESKPQALGFSGVIGIQQSVLSHAWSLL